MDERKKLSDRTKLQFLNIILQFCEAETGPGQGGHGNPFDETHWSLVQSRGRVFK